MGADQDIRQRLWANGAVRFGVWVLGLMLLLALAAPGLGTVEPGAMDSNYINKPAFSSGPFALPDGSTVTHTFWLGTDSFGRDIYSRVIYGTHHWCGCKVRSPTVLHLRAYTGDDRRIGLDLHEDIANKRIIRYRNECQLVSVERQILCICQRVGAVARDERNMDRGRNTWRKQPEVRPLRALG